MHTPEFIKVFKTKDFDLFLKKNKRLIFPNNIYIFYQGHFPSGFHVLVHGTVQISYKNNSKNNNFKISAPVAIGLSHVVKNTPYLFSMETVEDVEMHFIPKYQCHSDQFLTAFNKITSTYRR